MTAHLSDFALQRRALCAACQAVWVEDAYEECADCRKHAAEETIKYREKIDRQRREDEAAKAWARHWSELNDAEQYDHHDPAERSDDDDEG